MTPHTIFFGTRYYLTNGCKNKTCYVMFCLYKLLDLNKKERKIKVEECRRDYNSKVCSRPNHISNFQNKFQKSVR